jgi:hypothetical protein
LRFYFPDSQDQIDPSFDFETEQRSPFRIRQRDDEYAHEVFGHCPYTGLLVSKAIVDGVNGAAGRYSAQQRQRLYREGVREFFRLDNRPGPRISTMGDCGAFTYIREELPPYTVDEVIDFYEECGFDAGLAMDHVVPGFVPQSELHESLFPEEWCRRHCLTLELATEFLARHGARRCLFEPVGVAQGWSGESYAEAVAQLQQLGYERIALGGLVPLKTPDLLNVLESVGTVLQPGTKLHLLGVTRCDHIADFQRYGVTSFDSTSPFRQAFKDDRDNYYSLDRAWIALRVPQVEGNAKLQGRVRAGEIDQRRARRLEQAALKTLVAFDNGDATVDDAVTALRSYEALYDGKCDRSERYREVLEAAPWKACVCEICTSAGIQVMLFRGTERNKRRGFHNLYIFAERLQRELDVDERLELCAT